MKRLFTFLGTGRYQETNYALDGRTCRTPHFALALREWIPYDEVTFFLTPKAEAHENWSMTRSQFEARQWQFGVCRIPNGESESELWEIFERLTSAAVPGDSVAFDITHGFRSIPLLGLLAATFLRRAVGLDLENIYYGAYEAPTQDQNTPVFELTPFLDLLEWLSGVEQFVETGDSRQLAGRLREIQNHAKRTDSPNPPMNLIGLATSLQSLSLSLALSRPLEVGRAAQCCLNRMSQAQDDLNQGHARPLVPLLERIRQTYGPLEDSSPLGQARMVAWYLDRQHTIQAVTLAREWIVSYVCRLMDLNDMDERERSEKVLNDAIFQKQGALKGTPSELLPNFLSCPVAEKLTRTWAQVRTLRNDLAHCGFRKDALRGNKILSKASELGPAILGFAEQEANLEQSPLDQDSPIDETSPEP